MPQYMSNRYSGINPRGYDPSLAEEAMDRQDRANKEQLDKQAQLGQINAQGISALGDAAAGAISGGVGGYYKGKKSAEDTAANQMRLDLSEEDLNQARKQHEFLNAAPSEEEADTNYGKRQQLEMRKLESEADKKTADEWVPTDKVTANNEPIMFNKTTGKYQTGAGITVKSKEDKIPNEWADTGRVTDKNEPIMFNKATGAYKVASGITVGKKPGEEKESPGQTELDKTFAKDLNEWETNGKTAHDKNMERLVASRDKLQAMVNKKKDPRGIMGQSASSWPDALKKQDAIVIRDDVRAASQGALKAALGSQFTEKEGERIQNNAYNENLPPSENLKKINLAIDELNSRAGSMNERGSHFRKNKGSLAGYAPSEIPRTAAVTPPPEPEDGTANAATGEKTEVGRKYSKSRKTTRVTYSDGSSEDIPDAK